MKQIDIALARIRDANDYLDEFIAKYGEKPKLNKDIVRKCKTKTEAINIIKHDTEEFNNTCRGAV